MSWADPIADMLTRIRNAQAADLDVVDIPHSRMKNEMMRVLRREGYIADHAVEGGTHKTLRVYLKYAEDREPAIRGLRRVSRPGLRHYVSAREIPRVLGGMGIAVLSTSAGILSDREARGKGTGGEVLCYVW